MGQTEQSVTEQGVSEQSVAARTKATGGIRRLMPIIALLTANGFSLAGNAITMIVVPLYVLSDTDSVIAAGVAGVFVTVPVIIGGAFGGVLVDRLGFRLAAIIADLASGITVLAIPLLAATVGLPFWALLALIFLSGLLDTPGNTAKSALLPDLATAAAVDLTRATGAQAAISRSAAMVGAATAAGAVVWLGPLNSLLLDAATFAISAALLWLLVPKQHGNAQTQSQAAAESTGPKRGTKAGTKLGYWRELADGIRFLASQPLLRNLVLLVVITNCIDAALLTVLGPVYARSVSPDGAFFGVMIACFAGGALVGSLLFAWLGHRLPRRITLVISFFLAGAPIFFSMALDLPAPALLFVFVVAGLSAGSINPLVGSVLYELIPRDIRARVLGTVTTGASLGMPLGSLLGGAAVAGFGLVPTMIGAGAIYAVTTLTPLVGRSWLALDYSAADHASGSRSVGAPA